MPALHFSLAGLSLSAASMFTCSIVFCCSSPGVQEPEKAPPSPAGATASPASASGPYRPLIRVRKLSEQEKARAAQEKLAKSAGELENDLKAARGVRVVIDLLAEAKRPLVLHNGLLDLCHVYHSFLGPLPASLPGMRSPHAILWLSSLLPRSFCANLVDSRC